MTRWNRHQGAKGKKRREIGKEKWIREKKKKQGGGHAKSEKEKVKKRERGQGGGERKLK